MAGDPQVIHIMDQGGEAFVQLARHAARAYRAAVEEGMPPARALYMVCDMMRGAREDELSDEGS